MSTDSTVYEQLVAAGCTLDHHESDLYVLATAPALKILTDAKVTFSRFTSQNALTKRVEIWFDVPFRYDPWWEKKRAGRAGGAS